MILIAFHPAYATNTDWHDDAVSRQIQAETQCEVKGGIYENGACLPPNLTLAAEKELQAYTAQKQAEINRTWSKQWNRLTKPTQNRQ